ncbi:RDD family protein [Rhizobium leguminosarum]
MADWHYAVGQDQNGPVGEEEFRSLIRSGEINRETYVWRDGMDKWQYAGDHPDLANAFVSPSPLPSANPPTLPPPALQPILPNAGVVITSRPWPRFWARFIDNLILIPLLAFGVGITTALYAPDVYLQLVTMNAALFGALLLPLGSLLLAFAMSLTGSTIGKAIVGVRVPVPAGNHRLGFFLAREFRVWASGLGLGIPFVALFTQIHQYRRLVSGKTAGYDEGNPTVIANPSKLRLGVAAVIGLALFFGNIVLRVQDQDASRNLETTQTWVNPMTNKSAIIGKTWQPEEMTTNSGRAFYFASNELLAEAIFGYEQYPSEGVNSLAYAEAIKQAVASDVTITTVWQPITVQRMPGLRATGNSVKFKDSVIEVTIVVSGKNAWRTITFARGNSQQQSAEKDRFVQAMFGTVN